MNDELIKANGQFAMYYSKMWKEFYILEYGREPNFFLAIASYKNRMQCEGVYEFVTSHPDCLHAESFA